MVRVPRRRTRSKLTANCNFGSSSIFVRSIFFDVIFFVVAARLALRLLIKKIFIPDLNLPTVRGLEFAAVVWCGGVEVGGDVWRCDVVIV